MTAAGSNRGPQGRRIVLVTLGSWGDVVPYVSIALGLHARGHRAVVAACACYRARVEALGVPFRSLRPDADWVSDPARMRRRSHPVLGLIRVAREWLLPALAETYEDAAAAADGADLLVSHPLAAYAARLVAEKRRLPWVSTMLVPLGFFSAHDTLALPLPSPLAGLYHRLGPRARASILAAGRRSTRFLARPWYRLRAELGLPPARDGNPLSDSHSPRLVLAPFSSLLAEKQPDWPPQTVVTGFPFSPLALGSGLPAELARFLDEGPPPVVFTLGTAVGVDPGRFYETSLAAARSLGLRSVLVGSGAQGRPLAGTDGIALGYAPYQELFPRAAAVVHHGGIGTTGLALASGRPALVVPRAWDQPDNALRAARLGAARVLPWRRYTASRAAGELRHLLSEECCLRAAALRAQLEREDGLNAACDAIEGHLAQAASAKEDGTEPVA